MTEGKKSKKLLLTCKKFGGFVVVVYLLLLLFETVSLYSPGYPVDQAGSASRVLQLKVFATTPSFPRDDEKIPELWSDDG